MIKVSPLAPAGFPNLMPIGGMRIGGIEAGLKYKNRPDLLFATFDKGTTVAGAFATTSMPSPTVTACRERLPGGTAGALVANAGNSLAFTGRAGEACVHETSAEAARLAGCAPQEVFLAATGVIGQPPKPGAIAGALEQAHRTIGVGGWHEAAQAIMTTDTFAKGSGRIARIDGAAVSINGIAKGSGMIAPNMATMLAFLFTNASLPAPVLQSILSDCNERSFNSISVDSDSSTSDTVLLFATGAGARHGDVKDASDPRLDDFKMSLEEVMTDLAQQIVRDGEGAAKFITITVTGAENDGEAHDAAMSVANSPLVKTAIAGEDANWGRIVMAVGKSGVKASPDRLTISIGGQRVTKDGMIDEAYDEEKAHEHLQGREIDIAIDLGHGAGRARVWTCDLTYDYIRINADYRS